MRPGDVFLDAAVLRQPAFGDIHVRHHFHARDDGQREMARRRRHFVKRAIHAITNFEFALEWLEMNVARAILDRLEHDQIDEPNDRRGVRLGFDVGRAFVVAAQRHQLARVAELFQDILHTGGFGPVIAFDPVLDLLRRRNNDVDVFAERKAQIFRDAEVEWIDERDCESVVGKTYGQSTMQPSESARNQPLNFRRNLALTKIDKLPRDPEAPPLGDRNFRLTV